MRIVDVAVTIAAAGWAGAPPAQSRGLTVCMENAVSISDLSIELAARTVSSKVFAAIGVKIRWVDTRKCPWDAIYITFSGKIPAGPPSEALAYALPYEGTHIGVFLDRVKQFTEPSARGFGITTAV
jgi:hypothetical protein